MILVFLNFNIDIGTSRIGLIPDFIGYIFMLRGVSDMLPYSERFEGIKPHVRIMIAYSIVCYASDITGLTALLMFPLNLLLGLVSLILSLYISYNIIMGVKDIENEYRQDLNSGQLYSVWKLLAVFSFLSYVLYLIPVVAVICVIVGFIIGIYYLYVFNKTKRLFCEQNPEI